jgi:hypothetical protein
MILYRILLVFGLLLTAAWLTLLGVGVLDARPATLLVLLGLMALPCAFIVGGMWLAARDRYRLASIALGLVVLSGAAAIFLFSWSLATSTDL